MSGCGSAERRGGGRVTCRGYRVYGEGRANRHVDGGVHGERQPIHVSSEGGPRQRHHRALVELELRPCSKRPPAPAPAFRQRDHENQTAKNCGLATPPRKIPLKQSLVNDEDKFYWITQIQPWPHVWTCARSQGRRRTLALSPPHSPSALTHAPTRQEGECRGGKWEGAAPESVISRPAAWEGLPTKALAKRKARLSIGPEGGTPTCQSFTLPG